MAKKLESNFLNMALVLTVIALLVGAALSWVDALTFERREQNKIAKTLKAISLVDIPFDNDPLSEVLETGSGKVYILRSMGELTGFAVQTKTLEGYGGPIEVMVGYNPEGIIQKTATLSHKESPGIGSKITEEPFVQQFVQFDPESQSPLLVKDGGDIDAISGATVSSRAYSQDIQNSYSAYLSAKEYMSNPPAENKATDPNSDTQEGSADV